MTKLFFVQGYNNTCSYVTTAMPSPTEFAAFWNKIYSQSYKTCVMLNQQDNSSEVNKTQPTGVAIVEFMLEKYLGITSK